MQIQTNYLSITLNSMVRILRVKVANEEKKLAKLENNELNFNQKFATEILIFNFFLRFLHWMKLLWSGLKF
jgi:hypothetical protein